MMNYSFKKNLMSMVGVRFVLEIVLLLIIGWFDSQMCQCQNTTEQGN